MGRFRTQLTFLALALVLAGLSACGGDGDSGPTSTAEVRREAQPKADAEAKAHSAEVTRESRERQAGAEPTEDEQEAKESASDFYAILEQDTGGASRTTIDSESFCDLMSEEAKGQTIYYAKVSSGIAKKWDCESAVDLLVIRSKRMGGFEATQRAEVIGINARGDHATATVRFAGGPATSIPLVKEDGEWKLAATPAVAGLGN